MSIDSIIEFDFSIIHPASIHNGLSNNFQINSHAINPASIVTSMYKNVYEKTKYMYGKIIYEKSKMSVKMTTI